MARCSCGRVSIALDGDHIYCTACHCDDCQAAARGFDALPSPQPTMDAFGGTHYVLHRKDRYTIVSGDELLDPRRLRERTPTRRMLASCCNSPMFLAFDNAQHWITVYRARFSEDPPALQSRIAMKFANHAGDAPDDVPSYRTFPIALIGRLLLSRARMLLGR